MKVLITGAGGQLGCDLQRVLRPRHQVVAKTRGQLDVANADEVGVTLYREKPDAIIHAAAYTNVDRAETEIELAYEVNSAGTWNVAAAAQQIGAKLVYVSTDFVFDGTKKTPYNEDDAPNPLSVYGKSKLHGETFVSMLSDKYFIVRTSWLYGKGGTNFVTKVVSLARQHGKLSMVSDQIGTPTYCLDLAVFISQLIESEKYGLYHASNTGCCSRYEFAEEILKCMGMDQVAVTPVRAEQFPTPAARPCFSPLDNAAIRRNGFPGLRGWKAALHAFLRDDFTAEPPKA